MRTDRGFSKAAVPITVSYQTDRRERYPTRKVCIKKKNDVAELYLFVNTGDILPFVALYGTMVVLQKIMKQQGLSFSSRKELLTLRPTWKLHRKFANLTLGWKTVFCCVPQEDQCSDRLFPCDLDYLRWEQAS